MHVNKLSAVLQDVIVLQVLVVAAIALLFDGKTAALLAALAWYSRPPANTNSEFIGRARLFKVGAIPPLPTNDSAITVRVERWPLFCSGSLQYGAQPGAGCGTSARTVVHGILQFTGAQTSVNCVNVFGQWLPITHATK